uniref:Capsid protein n=1 Tax=Cotepeofons virus TaxID=3072204 RepID=A0AA96SJ93_9VIRU|nr:MAG: capsid protein [Cotepeofons virus]
MHSPGSHTVSHIMAKKKSNNNNNNNVKNNGKPRIVEKIVYRDKPMSIGAQIGHGLQNLAVSTFKRITGMGDYKVSPNVKDIGHNALMNKFTHQPPKFCTATNSFVFEHSEYIGDVLGSTGFTTKAYTINPADQFCFPWLSGLATSFESYQIEGMLFRYESTSGEATGTNTTLGSVMGYVSYDDLDAVSVTKPILLQYDGVVEAKPSESMLIGVECDPSRLVMDRLYVGPVASGSDSRFYNFGKFIVATAGQQQDGATLGELFVHYRIRFYVAKSLPSLTGSIFNRSYFSALAVPDASNSPFQFTSVDSSAEISLDITPTRIEWLAIPGATYVITCCYAGGTLNAVAPNITVLGGALAPYFNNSAINNYTSGFGTNTGTVTYQYLIKASDSNNSTVITSFLTTGGVFPSSPSLNGYLYRLT